MSAVPRLPQSLAAKRHARAASHAADDASEKAKFRARIVALRRIDLIGDNSRNSRFGAIIPDWDGDRLAIFVPSGGFAGKSATIPGSTGNNRESGLGVIRTSGGL
jgi:hypothetical protein